jgi:uncharacterized protein (TIGR00369 family)
MTEAESTPPWREPVRGAYFDASILHLTGLDQLHDQIARDRRPPIGRLTGMHLIEANPGGTVFEMPLSRWMCGPHGVISIGPLALVADGALGTAVLTMLPPATPFTTSELSLRMLAPARPGSTIIARARAIHVGASLALSEATLRDENGRLIGHGTSLCAVLPPLGGGFEGHPDPPAVASDAPDPYLRPVRGEFVPGEVWERETGLEVLASLVDGSRPLPPLHHLTGMALTSVSAGAATLTLPASEWLSAPPRGRLQGGATAMLAETALSAAIQTTLPAGTACAPIDLKVNYLRPAVCGDGVLVATGSVQHRGRKIAVASSEVLGIDGRPVALATGSAMVLEPRA